MSRFKLSDIQAQAILDMQLRRLAALERYKIEQEYNEVKTRIKEVISLLKTPSKLTGFIKDELAETKAKIGNERRTKIFKGKIGEINEEDLVAQEQTLVTISKQGYIKRTKIDTYQAQKRGGIGKRAITTKEDDSVRHIFKCETHDQILFFTNRGKVYALKVYEIPEYSRTAKGIPLVNLIQIGSDELVTSVLTRNLHGSIIDEDITQEGEERLEHGGKDYKYLFMATKDGTVKKTGLDEFENIRSNGLIAIKLDDTDELIWVKPTTGSDEIVIITKGAKAIHFHEDDVRPIGRSSRGVRGIKLSSENVVISMDVVRRKEDFVLTVSSNGYGKLSTLKSFTIQNRGGTGIFAAKVNSKTGTIVASRLLDHPDKELLIISEKGQAVRIATKDLPIQARQTAGVRLMKIKTDDHVAAIAIV